MHAYAVRLKNPIGSFSWGRDITVFLNFSTTVVCTERILSVRGRKSSELFLVSKGHKTEVETLLRLCIYTCDTLAVVRKVRIL